MPSIQEIEEAIPIGSSCELFKLCCVCNIQKNLTEFRRVNSGSSLLYPKSYLNRRVFCRDCRKKRTEDTKPNNTFNNSSKTDYDINVLARILLNDQAFDNNDILYYYGYQVFNACIKERDNHICTYCKGLGSTVDHITPFSKGGKSTLDNCCCACEDCQQRKDNGMKR